MVDMTRETPSSNVDHVMPDSSEESRPTFRRLVCCCNGARDITIVLGKRAQRGRRSTHVQLVSTEASCSFMGPRW
jgi:hypothetical protein